MQLPRQPQFGQVQEPVTAPELLSVLQAIWQQIARVINTNLTFGSPATAPDNMKGAWYDATTPGANVEFAVTHNLGYVPQGWLVVYQNKAASVYASTTTWTNTQIFLKCDTATVHVRIFVIG